MAGDTTKANAAYQDFFTLWKDADPDIPILKEAKAECRSCSNFSLVSFSVGENRLFRQWKICTVCGAEV